MKCRILYIVLIGMAWLAGCTSAPHYPHSLQQAVLLMDSRPDSALALLQGMDDSVATLTEEARMYHKLLTLQAEDKLYTPHTHDSLINSIVTFYEDYGDRAKLMLAYYYQGRVLRDMNDAPRSLKAFQQAVKLNHPDYKLLAKVYSQMGYLFAYQGLYDEAIQASLQTIRMYEKLGEENKTSYALRDIARMHNAKARNDSSLIYYKKALRVTLANADSVRYYDILGELGGQYYKMGVMDTAKHILLIAACCDKIRNKSHIYTCLGDIYQDEMCWDSVFYYRNKAMTNGNIHKVYSNRLGLYAMERARKNHQQALEHLEAAMVLMDSIKQITQTEAVSKINSLYNYQHTEEENAKLKLNKERQQSQLLMLVLFSISACLGFIALILYYKKNRQRYLIQAKEQQRIYEECMATSREAMESNREEIANLDILLEKAKHENNHLMQELYLIQKEKLELRNQEISLTIDEQELRMATFKQSDCFELLQQAGKDDTTVVSSEYWERIEKWITAIYPNFNKHLEESFSNLSEYDKQICWLTKLGFSPIEISNILKRSKQAITNARTRLYKKANLSEHSCENFDAVIGFL